MKTVVCLLYSRVLKNSQTVYLAVSRKDNPDDFGLPGGKVDEGEMPIVALYRECIEETAFIPRNAKLIHVGQNSKYKIMTFTCTHLDQIDEVAKEDGVVAWVELEVLFQGSFGQYNKNMWDNIKEYTHK